MERWVRELGIENDPRGLQLSCLSTGGGGAIRKLNRCSTSWRTARPPRVAGRNRISPSAVRTDSLNSGSSLASTWTELMSTRPVVSTTKVAWTRPSLPSALSLGG